MQQQQRLAAELLFRPIKFGVAMSQAASAPAGVAPFAQPDRESAMGPLSNIPMQLVPAY